MNRCETKIGYLNEMTKVWSGKGIKKTTERERYSSFRPFLLLADYLHQILKYFLETFQEFLCFVHAEAKRRQQAEHVRAAYAGEYMLLFQQS